MPALGCGLLAGVAGCRSSSSSGAGTTADASRQYPIRGTVRQVMPQSDEVLLQHDAVPGFMEAMTMAYRVTDPAALGELHPGDKIAATLLVDQDAAGPKNLRLRDVVITAEAKPDYKPAVSYHVPAPGDAVPDIKLRNQSGKTIDLRQFRGEALLMTFVYTRCPLPEYCPRMSRQFAEIDHALAGDHGLYGKTHLLTVSFDPAYDTPAVLRSYGGAVTGRYTNETFAHWDFAVPTAAELPGVEQWFDLGVTAREGQMQHSLSTLVVGPDGKVRAFWGTNDWTVPQVLDALKAAAA